MKLKHDLNTFADSIAAAAKLQVKGHEQMIAFFNADMTRFKQWAKQQDLFDVFSGFVLDEEESQSETETTASCSINGDDESLQSLDGDCEGDEDEFVPYFNSEMLMGNLKEARKEIEADFSLIKMHFEHFQLDRNSQMTSVIQQLQDLALSLFSMAVMGKEFNFEEHENEAFQTAMAKFFKFYLKAADSSQQKVIEI